MIKNIMFDYIICTLDFFCIPILILIIRNIHVVLLIPVGIYHKCTQSGTHTLKLIESKI